MKLWIQDGFASNNFICHNIFTKKLKYDDWNVLEQWETDMILIHGFGNVLWVAFSIPSDSLSLVKYPVFIFNLQKLLQ
jgi:hypothetical protein